MQDCRLCELIDPHAPPVKPGVRGGVAGEIAGCYMPRGEGAGCERIVDALAGEWLHHARGVTDEEKISLLRMNSIALQWGDGSPGWSFGNCKAIRRPFFEL